MKLIIFDLDGTLANIDHRRHFVEGPKKDWNAFFEACENDTPNIEICWLFKVLQQHDRLIEVWSGRSKSVRLKTIEWFMKHEMYPIKVRMREIGDFRPDEVVKKEWLDEVGAENIAMVFDDRDKVVKMWRENGINCLQVANGAF
jgi:phosphoglycolate phosphatase-like HAD superfamily hydrolase